MTNTRRIAVAVSAAAVLIGGVATVAPNAYAEPLTTTVDDFMPVKADGDYFYALCAEPVKVTSLDRDGEETLQVPEKMVSEVSRILVLGEETLKKAPHKRPTKAMTGIGLALSETGLVEGAQTISDDALSPEARALYRLTKTNISTVPAVKVEETAAFPLKGTSVETGKETTCTGIPVQSNTEPDGGAPLPSSSDVPSATRSVEPSESVSPETEPTTETPSATQSERSRSERSQEPSTTTPAQTTESAPPSSETKTERTTVVPPRETVTETQSATSQRPSSSAEPKAKPEHTASQIIVTVKDTNNELVSGAIMQIKDERNVVLAQWESSNQPVTLVGETNRNYTIHQASAPKGLEASRDLAFNTGDKEQTVVTVVNSDGRRAKIKSVPTGPTGDTKAAVSVLRWGGERR